jgi:nucleoside transporter
MNSVRLRLSIMMFLEYFVWGSWAVAAGGYLIDTLRFTGNEVSWIFNTGAIAAMISPLFVGYIADRFFATERILALLHLVGGVLLIVAAEQTQFPRLLAVMLAYALCFMPTLALTNSISFHNIGNAEKEFPAIRVWGTIGWIASGLVVGILLGGKDKWFFELAGASSIALGLYCLTLPHTPPRPKEAGGDVLGLGAIGLLRETSFALFVACSFFVCVAFAFYMSFANAYLTETDRPSPTALMTIGQVSEIVFMAAMPFFIRTLGVKYMLLTGMLAWMARYWCFSAGDINWTDDFKWVLIGLPLHGVGFGLFFVGSQIYVDQKAPRHLRASAQSFIAFITFGVGIFLGNLTAGYVVDQNAPVTLPVTKADGQNAPSKMPVTKAAGTIADRAVLPQWRKEEEPDFWRYLDLSSTVRKRLWPQTEQQQPPDFAQQNDENKDGRIQPLEVPDKWREQKTAEPSSDDLIYDGIDIRSGLHSFDKDKDGGVDRPEWRRAQAHKWRTIWLWPAIITAATSLLFLLGFHERGEQVLREPMAEESVLGSGEGPEPQVG